MISKRAETLFRETPPLVEAHFKCAANPYNPVSNPEGYINLGTAENFLIEDKLLEKIKTIPPVSGKNLHYDFPWGSIELRKSYAEFLNKFMNIKDVTEDKIAVASGASALIEILSYIIFNEGDRVLIISPLYNGFYHDLETRFKAKVETSCAINNQGYIDIDLLDNDIKSTEVRALLINNPHNPLGYCYTKEDIKRIIEVAKINNVEIIADEVYANSVFGENKFISFLDPAFDDFDYKESIYHIYSIAKDFALSGFKVGFFMSFDKRVTQAVQSLTYFHTVSTQTQHTVTYLLHDHDWLNYLFETNKRVLRNTFRTLKNGLSKLGITSYPSNAGIFTMIDLSQYLKEVSAEAESKLFRFLINELRVNITPGQFFGYKSFGQFRVCYAKDMAILDEFLKRLKRLK